MAALEDFENTLKDVVNAKRVSASKMNRLTEIAMKSLENDTKLVAMLYKTHKSLPNSAKVSSLYAFDALARAARSSVNKRGITGDINSARGNAATFLLKIEGILDGLFQDMVSLDNSETKEKTKKVLDIWVKSNTFPATVLARLRDTLSDVRKAIFAGLLAFNEMRVSTEMLFRLLPSDNIVNPVVPVDSVIRAETSQTITPSELAPQTPAGLAPDVQATLLALLGKAAQFTGQGEPLSQTPPNTEPQLHHTSTQLALLQQLALTAKLSNGSPTPPPGHTPPPADATPSPAVISAVEPISRLPHTNGPRFDPPRDAQYARNGYADPPRDQRDFRDERHARGGGRGGFRGRGRWDGHHHDRFRHRDQDRELLSRPRRSRSRSPHRREERRNVRGYSPRRPLTDKELHHQPELPTPPSTAPDKDEFGRDVRASSSSPPVSTSVEDSQAPAAPMESSVDPTAEAPPDNRIPVSDQLPLVAASTSVQSTETHTPSSASRQPGLDQFDISAFDATVASSWEALGNMWQTTYGYLPSQEELMHFVMAGSMAVAGMASGGFNATQGGQWQQGNSQGPRRGSGWQGGRGGGSYHTGGRGGYGNYGDEGEYASAPEQSEPSSYAVLLNGDGGELGSSDPAADSQSIVAQDHTEELDEMNEGQASGGSGGRMQRVGDRWMFVKDGELEPGAA